MLVILLLIGVDSLSLNQALEIALRRSPGQLEALTELERARYDYGHSLAMVLPSVRADLGYSELRDRGVATEAYSGNLTLSQPILDLELASRVLAARSSLDGSRILEAKSRAELILRTSLAYYELVESDYLIKSAQVALSRARENERWVLERYELGAASRLERLEAEVFRLKAEQEFVRAENAKAVAQEELRSILDLEGELVPTDTFCLPTDTVVPSLDSLLGLLPLRNYDLRLIETQLRTARLRLTESYFSFLPRVGLFYRVDYSEPRYPRRGADLRDGVATSFGIGISLPIFELPRLYFNNRIARTEYRRTLYQRRQLELMVQKELKTSYYLITEALRRIAYAQRELSGAEAACELAREQYRLGAASLLDLLTNESNLYAAQLSYITSLKDYYSQRARFTYLLAMEKL